MAIVAYIKKVGTNGDNTITGTNGPDWMEGLDGTDTLYGGDMDDVLSGGIDGKVDQLYGDYGSDTVYYGDVTRDMTIDLGAGANPVGCGKLNAADIPFTINGYSSTYHIDEVLEDQLHSIENVTAGRGNDTIIGSSEDNRLFGNDGNDIIDGRGGSDILIGGKGADILTGGSNADTFTFQNVTDSNSEFGLDRITDFTRGSDKIDLSAIDANINQAGNQAFQLVAPRLVSDGGFRFHYETGFTGHAGELALVPVASPFGLAYAADIDGDAVADMTFFVQTTGTANTWLTSSDFIL